MNLEKKIIQFSDTNYFSKIVVDYLNHDDKLKRFIQDFPSKNSLEKQIELKKKDNVNRKVLHEVITQQYDNISCNELLRNNIDALLDENTFTICTAHQPCIFTGPLYFIYKISHAIKLAQECKNNFPAHNFVPVFYMGTEDNDIEEIGTFFLDKLKLQWQTSQSGACGRMFTDEMESITHEVLSILNANTEDEKWLIELITKAYLTKQTLANATRIFVNGLFENYGLVVLDADNEKLKKIFSPVIKDELFHQNSHKLVEETSRELSENYKTQAGGREINLFYLKEIIRERIEKKDNRWVVNNTDISFSETELHEEINNHPEHFSPNVILRPLYQEMILPNIAFIGGGAEVAYWLELKKVFDLYKISFPIILLRNSFLFIEKKESERMKKLALSVEDIFITNEMLYKKVLSENDTLLNLQTQLSEIENAFLEIEKMSGDVNINLTGSVKAHQTKAKKITDRITQKFIAHLKRNETEKMQQIDTLKTILFPNNSLQERHDNFIPYFKKYGKKMIDDIISNQSGIESEFIVLSEK